MTDPPHSEPYAPWGEPARPAAATPVWWRRLATLPALVRHLVLMLVTMAVITTINLLTTPGTWWSLALLVIWVAVVIIHGIGIASLGLLLDDDAAARPARRASVPMPVAEPEGPPAPRASGANAAGWRLRRQPEEPAVPPTWELPDDDDTAASGGWPAAPPAASPPPPAEDEAESAENPVTTSWRAVTDFAWRRRRGGGQRGDRDPDTDA